MAVTMGVRDCFLEQVTVELEGQGGIQGSNNISYLFPFPSLRSQNQPVILSGLRKMVTDSSRFIHEKFLLGTLKPQPIQP